MEYDIELNNDDNMPIGRVKFYDANFEEEEGFFFFHGLFGKLKELEGSSGDLIVKEEVVFEIWITGEDIEWGEGVDTNPRRKSLTIEEQNILAKDLRQFKDDYITDFGS
jgi:hypothetical protein|tara:strand:+ start:998 stop:1324 length:327 start_codon:yes stop_codon:yes gene_type:complete